MAITPNDILETLEKMVLEVFPGEKTYRERVESGFERPSTLIVYEGGDVEPAYGSNMVEMRDRFTMTAFVKVDDYHNSHMVGMHLRQMKLVGLLIPGFIKVKDRCPKIIDIERSGGYDFDTVTFTVSYTLGREEFMNIQQLPLMEHLHISEEVKSYG